jgi:histidine triad (HIT) family protein
MATIFSRIIRGEIPCHKVYEDAHVFAFLDINPVSPGHTLVIPKQEAVTLADLDDEHAAALGRALPRVARAIKQVTGCPAYNLLQNNGELAGQVVMHAHVHLIPRYAEGSAGGGNGGRGGSGLSYQWPASKLDPAEGAALAERLRGAIR